MMLKEFLKEKRHGDIPISPKPRPTKSAWEKKQEAPRPCIGAEHFPFFLLSKFGRFGFAEKKDNAMYV